MPGMDQLFTPQDEGSALDHDVLEAKLIEKDGKYWAQVDKEPKLWGPVRDATPDKVGQIVLVGVSQNEGVWLISGGSSGQRIENTLMGIFLDFANGVTDATVRSRDPGSPTRLDQVTINGDGQLKYRGNSLLPMLPKTVRFTSSIGSAGYISVNHSRWTTWTFHGRLYAYFSVIPSSSVPLVRWREDTADRCRFQVNTSGKVEIRSNTNALLGISQEPIEAGKVYRFEWEVIPHASEGIVIVRIYDGQGTSPIEMVVSSPANTGAKVTQTRFGNTNNGNTQTTLSFGGFADALRHPSGPYEGPPKPTLGVFNPDTGDLIGGFDHDGSFFLCATSSFTYDSGRFRVRPGEEIFRFDANTGTLVIGVDRVSTKPQVSGGVSLFNGYDIGSGRWHGRSYNLDTVNDPPDITMKRAESSNMERTGTNGETNGSEFSSGTVDFWPIDIDRYIVVGGVEYIIREIVDQHTAILEDKFTRELVDLPVATGVAWEVSQYPWPHTISAGKGAIGQWRTNPVAAGFIRGGSDGNTFGTTQFQSSSADFTSADVDRYIMIGDSPTRVYQIVARVSPTQITLKDPDPITATGQNWRIAGGPHDDGIDPSMIPHTMVFRAEDGILCFSDDQQDTVVPRASWAVRLPDPTIFLGHANGFATRDIVEILATGIVEILENDIEILKPGKGIKLVSPNGLVSKRLTIDNTGALIVT